MASLSAYSLPTAGSCLQVLALSGHSRCLRHLASISELQVAASMCLWLKYFDMQAATRAPTRSTCGGGRAGRGR